MKHLIAIAFFGISSLSLFAQNNGLALQGPSMVSYTIAENVPERLTAQNAAQQISDFVTDHIDVSDEFYFVNEARIKAAVEISADGNIKKVEIMEGSNSRLERTLTNVIKEYKSSERLESNKDYTVIIPFVFTN